MLILCGIFFSLCYGIWIFSNSFWIFLLGFLLRTLGIGIAVAFGGFFSEFSYSFTLAASAISILIVSIIAFMWPEIKSLTPTGEENYWDFLKNSIKTIKNNSSLIKIVLFSAVVMSIFANLEEYNDVYLQFLGFPNHYIGLIFTVATIGQSIASMYAHKFKHYAWTTLNSIALIGFIILLLASFIKLPIMATGILLLGILLELSGVLNQGIIQKEVPETQRATISSLNSFMGNILPFQLIFGVIANQYNLQLSYFIFALCIVPYFIFLIVQKLLLRIN